MGIIEEKLPSVLPLKICKTNDRLKQITIGSGIYC